jgi:2-dehydro-3-deoxyphosphooctonate aldolase (KDO 8-P synthase)
MTTPKTGIRQGVTIPDLFRAGGPFFLIAGPCVLENDALNLQIASELARIGEELGLPIIFKASFDKANRSRADAPRGPGLERGLEQLALVRRETGLPTLTDIHEPWQAVRVAEVCDVLQVPAFLCRQTDLVEAVGATGLPANIKKGQWMAPEELAGAVSKARAAGAGGISVTERGTFFGYGDLVVDMRAFDRMRDATGAPVVFDGTHSVQRPGKADGASGGDPRFTPPLVRAAAAAGMDALFMEVHPRPEEGISDRTNMLPLHRLRALLEEVLAIRAALGLPSPNALVEAGGV